jgi:hypothetical protein
VRFDGIVMAVSPCRLFPTTDNLHGQRTFECATSHTAFELSHAFELGARRRVVVAAGASPKPTAKPASYIERGWIWRTTTSSNRLRARSGKQPNRARARTKQVGLLHPITRLVSVGVSNGAGSQSGAFRAPALTGVRCVTYGGPPPAAQSGDERADGGRAEFPVSGSFVGCCEG